MVMDYILFLTGFKRGQDEGMSDTGTKAKITAKKRKDLLFVILIFTNLALLIRAQ